MRRLMFHFNKKQDIPLQFLHVLRSSFNYYYEKEFIFNVDKTLVLGYNRGILPKNIENHIQLMQFIKLFLSTSKKCQFEF